MNRAGEVLGILREGAGFVSGDLIASRLCISRTAVWKIVQQLDRMGYACRNSAKGKDTGSRARPTGSTRGRSSGTWRRAIVGREIRLQGFGGLDQRRCLRSGAGRLRRRHVRDRGVAKCRAGQAPQGVALPLRQEPLRVVRPETGPPPARRSLPSPSSPASRPLTP